MISGNVFRVGSADDGTLGGLTPVAAVTLTTPHLIVRLTSSLYVYYISIEALCVRIAADTRLEVLGILFPAITAVTAGTARTFNNMRSSMAGPLSLACTENPTNLTGTATRRRAFYRVFNPALGTQYRDGERADMVCLGANNAALGIWFVSATATGDITWMLRADQVV